MRVFETSNGDLSEIRYVVRRVLRAERKDGWHEGYSDGREDQYYGTEAKLEAARLTRDKLMAAFKAPAVSGTLAMLDEQGGGRADLADAILEALDRADESDA